MEKHGRTLPQDMATSTESFLACLGSLTVSWVLCGGVSGSLTAEASGKEPQSEKGLVAQLMGEFLQGCVPGVLGVGPTIFSSGLAGHREVPGPQPGAGKEAECQGAGAGASQSEAEEGRLLRRLLSNSNSSCLCPTPSASRSRDFKLAPRKPASACVFP